MPLPVCNFASITVEAIPITHGGPAIHIVARNLNLKSLSHPIGGLSEKGFQQLKVQLQVHGLSEESIPVWKIQQLLA